MDTVKSVLASVFVMNTAEQRLTASAILLVGLFAGGCGTAGQQGAGQEAISVKTELGTTIGALAEIFAFDAAPVEGYGLVGGLNDTGSSECPSYIRAYLEQYILRQFPSGKVDVDTLISSKDTAVVRVRGLMPAAVRKNERFDVQVESVAGTQTTSLEAGVLYGADLKAAGSFGLMMKTLARAEGPVFIDTISDYKTDKKRGYILGGGLVLDEYTLNLALREPDYRTTSAIRDRLNARFGPDTARAVSQGQIDLRVPAGYERQKRRFISIVKAMYFDDAPQITRDRIRTFVRTLAVNKDEASEIALEAIGNSSLGKLSVLLNSSSEQVRLRAARCMLNLGGDAGLNTLREMATDKSSSYRMEALEAIVAGAARKDAAAICRTLLRDDDFDIRLAAYENLRRLEDITITQKVVADNFTLEQVAQTQHKSIFVSRSGRPRVVLFGAPIYCRDNIFVQSEDGKITLNAPAGAKFVSIIRKHPKRSNVIIQLKSSFELSDIIETLCAVPVRETEQDRRGLGIPYADMIGLLNQLSDKGAVGAEFRAGPLPKI